MPLFASARRSEMLQAIIGECNSGKLRLYSGARPANADTALSGNTLLAELTLAATSFTETGAVLTANAITSDAAADATGTASFARIVQSDGSTVVMDLSVGVGSGELQLNSLSIVANAPVSCSSCVVRFGPADADASLFLEPSSSGRYLQRDTGEAFLLRGYTAWSAIPNLTLAEFEDFLDTIVAHGFNAVILEAIDAKYTFDPPENINGDLPFTGTVGGKADFTTPNSAYWDDVDDKLEAARVRGVICFLLPAYYGFNGSDEGWGSDGTLSANGTTRLTTYGQWFGSRYAAQPNIVIVNYGDHLPDATGRGLVEAIRDGIVANDAAGRLHTSHFAPNSLSTDNTQVEVGANWAYAYGNFGNGTFAQHTHDLCLEGWDVAGPVPVFLGEDWYTHRSTELLTEAEERFQKWGALLSGACGGFHGNSYTWSFDVPYSDNPAPVDHWYDNLEDGPTLDFARALDFIEEREWTLLVPSTGTGLVTSGGGTRNTTGYKPRALASDGSWGAVYTLDGSTVTINLALFSGTVTARWFDPTNGEYSAVSGGPTFANSGTRAFVASSEVGNNADGAADWVLALETA